ncbi:molybdopterin-dependent oxidoreductase [soil metagenome]
MVLRAMMGATVRRKEDPRLINGSSMYVGDLKLPGMLHAIFLRSPFAHARINGINTEVARAAPGVVAVYTNEELRVFCGSMPGGSGGEGELEPDEIPTPKQEPLASGKVRWAGQAVAVVLAESEQQGRDAADMIEVDWEELPAVVDPSQAEEEDAPAVWEQVKNNIGMQHSRTNGDVEEAFANADVTISERILSQRLVPLPMEGRAVAASPDPLTGGLTVWVSTQAPHGWRNAAAPQLGLKQSQLRVIAPEVGGGFGAKFGVYHEELVVAAVAKHLKRPARWVETRSENFLATNHGRAQTADIELAATSEGKITGLRLKVLQDGGAYPKGLGLPHLTATMAVGCYDIPAVDLDIKAVYTNTMAIGAYRGAGRPEAAYYIERAIDILAHKIGKDPAEIRKLNYIAPEAFPVTTATGEKYDTGEYAKALDKALEVSNYVQLRKEQEEARNAGKLYGIGMASYVEICGFGPWESSTVKIEPSGAVSVYTGISPHGQGQETTFSQIVADKIGADFDDIVVHHGDTDNTAQGNGTGGSRGLVVGGGALLMSLAVIREKADKLAAHLLEVAPEDIELVDNVYRVKGSPDRSVTLAQIAGAAYGGGLPEGIEAGLHTTEYFSPDDETFPFGTHIAVVEIDRDSGKVELTKYFSIDDCGNVVSPQLLAGQIHGGLAQGIAQALWEEAVYDESGQLVTATLMDYAMPKADFFPQFTLDRTVTTSPLNPLGAKGIGEAATIGSTPAVANAVVDALSTLGITHLDIPATAPKVWGAIMRAKMEG